MKNISILLGTILILQGCATSQTYGERVATLSDLQLCIDNALLGTEESFLEYTTDEISRRGVDCSAYQQQIDTARSNRQSVQTSTSVVTGIFALWVGWALGGLIALAAL